MPDLTVQLTSGDGFLVVELDGEMDLASVQPIRERLLTIATTAPDVVIVDLAAVTFLDSTALGLFIAMHKARTEQSRAIVLVNVDPIVGRPITLTAVDTVLPVRWADTPVEASDHETLARSMLAELPLQSDLDELNADSAVAD